MAPLGIKIREQHAAKALGREVFLKPPKYIELKVPEGDL